MTFADLLVVAILTYGGVTVFCAAVMLIIVLWGDKR